MIGPKREVHVDEVLEDDRHDLAEAEGHDRQVVAAQAQGRRAEQDAEERRDGGRDDDDHQNGRWMPGKPAAGREQDERQAAQWGEARNAAVYAPRA